MLGHTPVSSSPTAARRHRRTRHQAGRPPHVCQTAAAVVRRPVAVPAAAAAEALAAAPTADGASCGPPRRQERSPVRQAHGLSQEPKLQAHPSTKGITPYARQCSVWPLGPVKPLRLAGDETARLFCCGRSGCCGGWNAVSCDTSGRCSRCIGTADPGTALRAF